MQIPKTVTDSTLIEMVRKQLVEVDRRHSDGYQDANSANGYLTEENHELLHAIHRGKGHVTTEVLGKTVSNMVVLIRMSRLYFHNNPESVVSVHGLDE